MRAEPTLNDATPSPLTGAEESPRQRHYYELIGEQHDGIMRCNDCRKIVLHADLVRAHGCPFCGTRRVVEIQTLTFWEWLKIYTGIMDFPYRKEFLEEFARGRR